MRAGSHSPRIEKGIDGRLEIGKTGVSRTTHGRARKFGEGSKDRGTRTGRQLGHIIAKKTDLTKPRLAGVS